MLKVTLKRSVFNIRMLLVILISFGILVSPLVTSGRLRLFLEQGKMLWLLLIYSPLWAGCGFLMETQKQCLNLRLYRYKSLKQWWYPFVLQIYVLNLLWFVLLALLLMLHGLKAPGISVAIFCICFHSIFMLSVMIYIYVFTRNAAIAFIVLILCEAASVIFTSMGIPPAAMPLVWGMYRYSYERYGAGGFWLTEMTAMMLVLILPVFLLPAIKRGKEWLLR